MRPTLAIVIGDQRGTEQKAAGGEQDDGGKADLAWGDAHGVVLAVRCERPLASDRDFTLTLRRLRRLFPLPTGEGGRRVAPEG